MSVPPDRMAPRTGAGIGRDPNKIMGLPKWAFFVIIALGIVLAYYIYKRSQVNNNTTAAGTTVNDNGTDTTSGLTAADIGGTPADNSFATQTDETALEEQIQTMQNTISQLEQTNGGNGASVGPHPGGDSTTGTLPTQPETPPPNSPAGVTYTGTLPNQVDIPVWTNAIQGGTGPMIVPDSGGIPLPAHLAGAIPNATVQTKVAGGKLTQ